MRLKGLGIFLLTCGLLFSGSASISMAQDAGKAAANAVTAPTPHVKELIDKFQLEVVDYAYTLQAIGNGTHSGAKALLIDARPNPKYLKGTIPSSINIPDTQIDQYIGQLDKVAKDKEIIVFCGGWGCEKSPIVAGHLQGLGYSNVKLYQAGEPEWAAQNYLEVGIPVVQSALQKDSALLMDARPRLKYLAETIPGSLYMNDEELDKLAGRFPIDKKTPIIAFCGGYQCHKSHIVATRLLELGYTDVSVFAGGLPAWKKADLQTTASAKKAVVKDAPAQPVFIDGVKVGADEGTVDGEWLKSLIVSEKVPENIAIIDIRNSVDYATGHMQGTANIEAGKLGVEELTAQLPKDKVVVFTCGTGARAMEAFFKLKDGKQDVSKFLYFDANITCTADNTCEIEVNEPLG